MTSNLRVHPAHAIRLYIVSLLSSNNIINLSDYNGIPFLVESQDDASHENLNKPYGVFSYADSESTEIPQHRYGYMYINMFGRKPSEISPVTNTISLAFEDSMFITPSINSFNKKTSELDGIRFGYLCIDSVNEIVPPEQEGERYSQEISISYSYVRHAPVKLYNEASDAWA